MLTTMLVISALCGASFIFAGDPPAPRETGNSDHQWLQVIARRANRTTPSTWPLSPSSSSGHVTTQDVQSQNGLESSNGQGSPFFRKGIKYKMRGIFLRGVTLEEEPFVMKRENKDGTYKYSGFCIDILNELAKNLGFTYELYEVPDHKFGAPEGNGSHWNGMVGEVMYNRADIAIGPLTISAIRERVVDFTHPFMDHGVGMVSKKPEPKGSGIFGFLLPFDSSVWFSILGALIGVALLLFITSKVRHKMRAGDVNYDNDEKFDLKNSLWLTYWSIVRKGGEPAPRSLPSRILTGAWWLFTLIVISTYTANLTAFLTVKRLVAPINSVEDLVSSSVPYGCVKDAFLYSFFRAQANLNGSSSVWGRMWHAMTAYDEFPYSPFNGIEIVKRGQFVFIQETPFLEYVIKKDPQCELMMLGKPFLYKGYGFPVRRGDNYLKDISVEILKMQESGLIDQIKTKWWNKDGCPLDGEIANVNEVTALGIETFLGVFYVLLGASALALLVTIGQIIHKKLTKKKRPRMIKPSSPPPGKRCCCSQWQ
ncbi:glutamate receptor 4-like isoform X1 [Branchiostoma floridae x Branchiostoma japonicum]